MQLRTVRLERVRRFNGLLELDDLREGINLIYGPNETGKSTIQMAIAAAFLEKYSSQAPQQELAPRDQPDARPRVQVTFVHDGETYELTKEFFRRGGTCVLRQGSTTFTGEEAVARLVGLFRFEAPSSRLISEAQLGLPGVFWVPQGGALGVEAALDHARVHFIREIGDEIGSARETAADALVERLRRIRTEVVTPTGRGGPLAQARRDLDRCEVAVAQQEELQRNSKLLRDRLAQIQAELTDLEAQGVEATLGAEIEVIGQRHVELRAMLAARERMLGERVSLDERIADANQRLSSLTEEIERLRQFEAEAVTIEGTLAEREAELERHRSALVSLQAQDDRLGLRQAFMRLEREHQASIEQLAAVVERENDVRARQRTSLEIREQIEHLSEQLQAVVVAEESADQLAELEARCVDLRARLQAVSTKVTVEIVEAGRLYLDGKAQLDSASLLLEEEMLLEVPGIARISLVPQQRAAALRLELDAAEADLADRLRATGAKDVGELRRREQERHDLASSLDGRRRELAQLLGDADPAVELADLERRREVQAQRCEAIAQERAVLAESFGHSSDEVNLSPEAIDQLHGMIGFHTTTINRLEDEVRASREERLVKTEAIRWLMDSVDQRGGADGVERLRDRLDQLTQERERVDQDLAALDGRIGTEDLASLEERSVELHQRMEHHKDRIRRYREERGELIGQIRGDPFSEEELAGVVLARDRARTLVAALEERSEALATLIEVAEGIIADVQADLTAPLRDRLISYANHLFLAASVELDAAFKPRNLLRDGVVEPVSQLSFGTREQMALLTRLGVADLMAERGVPVFLMLDDAILNADGVRLTRLKTILTMAARRYQILIFTCRPELFSDLEPSRTIDLAATIQRS